MTTPARPECGEFFPFATRKDDIIIECHVIRVMSQVGLSWSNTTATSAGYQT